MESSNEGKGRKSAAINIEDKWFPLKKKKELHTWKAREEKKLEMFYLTSDTEFHE
jgi:hypothetical protein